MRRWLTSLALVSCCAVSSPATAWRDASELPDLGGEGRVTWASSELRYSVVPDPPAGWTDAAFLNASGRAVDTWNAELCGPSVSYVSAPSRQAVSGDGIVTVEALRSTEWRDRGFDDLAAATTDLLYERSSDGWRIVDAEILVNGGVAWGEEGGDGVRPDIEGAVAHEWGHALGLLHCCEPDGADGAPACDGSPHCDGALMFPIHQGVAHRQLAEDDRAGVCALYPAPGCEGPDCPDCVVDGDCAEPDRCRAGRCMLIIEPQPCAADAHCEVGQRCEAGRCISAEIGDPCLAAEECATGSCEDGYCSRGCDTDAECPTGFGCADARCHPSGSGFAESCREASDCGSRVCVEGTRTAPFCSRSCSSVRPCPSGWSCGQASGESVCVPEPIPAGCSAGYTRAPRSAALLILLPLLFVAWPRRKS